MTRTLLLLFLTLLFAFTSSQPAESDEFKNPFEDEGELPTLSDVGWTALDLSQANTNPQIKGLLYIGVQGATQQAVNDGAFPSGTYSLVQVNSIEEKQEVKDVQRYRFNIDVSNDQGQTETIIFEITYVPLTGASHVGSYAIPVQETEQELETETEQFFPFEEEMLKGYVPLDLDQASTDIQIQGLLQIGVKNATEQAIQNGSLPDGDYQVTQVNSIEQNMNIIDAEEYRFDVNISSGDNNPPSNLVFEIMYYPISGTSQVTSYSISTNYTPPPPTETYTPLDVNALSTNPQIQGLIVIGIQNFTQEAIQNGTLPSGTYQLQDLNSVGQGTLNPNAYQFNVTITNNQGTYADTSFALVYDNVSGTTEIISYSIDKFVTIPNVNNFTNTTNPDNTSNITGLPEGYTPVDTTSSAYAKAYQVAEYGLSTVTASAMLSGQLPYSLFSLTGVNGVGKKVEEGIDYYWFDVYIANASGNTARLVYTVWSNPTAGTSDVVEYNLYNVT